MKKTIVLALVLGFVLAHCKKDDTPEEEVKTYPAIAEHTNIDINNLYNYADINWPNFYDPETIIQFTVPDDNPITDKGATLGRVLFYDKILSVNNTIACASCHIQEHGFTDPERFSTGFEGGKTGAHSMRLANIAFFKPGTMFWDKRAPTLEAQTTMPIQDGIEMGFDEAHGGFAALIDKMNNTPYYSQLFEWVYGTPEITEEKVQKALAQFMRSMVSFNSKFDEGFKQVYGRTKYFKGVLEDFPNFTESENRGKYLFIEHTSVDGLGCSDCHNTPSFTSPDRLANNGLDEGETRLFKAPSLKNVGVTGPYMHDGRFGTLREVINHYDTGIKKGPALDPHLVDLDGNPLDMNISETDKEALINFLHTLTDAAILTDPKYSNPFVK